MAGALAAPQVDAQRASASLAQAPPCREAHPTMGRTPRTPVINRMERCMGSPGVLLPFTGGETSD